jgi:nucleoside-diphosphate-sugar epimerase
MANSLGLFQIFESDLDNILENISKNMESLKGKSISIFGSTGFVGKWLVAALINADKKLNLELNLNLFTRDGEKLQRVIGDKKSDRYNLFINDFSANSGTRIPKSDFYFHLATSSTIASGSNYEKNVHDSTLNAINQTIMNLRPENNPPIFIHTSSGAVYGRNQRSNDLILEGSTIEISQENSLYCNVKISAESLLRNYTKDNLLLGMNPRLFTFAGPYITLNEHFAIGNFVQNLINKENIFVAGNPETLRSYMYPSDLITWLIKLALNPTTMFLNFGSDKKIKIGDLAEMVASIGKLKVLETHSEGNDFSNYVPSTENARKHLKIDSIISLESSIEKWIKWLYFLKKIRNY